MSHIYISPHHQGSSAFFPCWIWQRKFFLLDFVEEMGDQCQLLTQKILLTLMLQFTLVSDTKQNVHAVSCNFGQVFYLIYIQQIHPFSCNTEVIIAKVRYAFHVTKFQSLLDVNLLNRFPNHLSFVCMFWLCFPCQN